MKNFISILTAATILATVPAFGKIAPLPPQYEAPARQPKEGVFEKLDENQEPLGTANICGWSRYRANFGMEKIYVRFPHEPTVTQGNALYVAYAYDSSACYTLTGYYPPIGNINPRQMFDETLYAVSQPPYDLLHHSVYYCDYYDYWVLDYVMLDTYKNMMVESRTVVTPFNAYTMQSVYPYGYSSYHDYYIDSFRIKCECSN